jgi:probable rRNA maturation factor
MAKGLPARQGQSQERSTRGKGPTHGYQPMLSLRNRQRVRRVDLRVLRRIAQALLRETWPEGHCDLGICIVAETEMTALNETFLRHQGSTDVITFDYAEIARQPSRLPRSAAPNTSRRDPQDASSAPLHGEIFVCVDEAVLQARRFRTNWQSELVRYVVHGVLHLLGYEDLNTRARRKMKTAEDTLVNRLARRFAFRQLGPQS